MRWTCWVLAMVVCAGAWAGPRVEAKVEGRSVVVSVDGKVFTVYKFGEEQKYPYFFPVNGPGSGASVTTETSEPYPHHHSLFFGCDKVNGANYWQEGNERGQIVSQGISVSQAAEGEARFEDVCLWRVPGQEAVIRDARRIRVLAPSESLRYIDFEIGIEALVDVVIEKTNHSLFAARMAPELSVKQGGVLVNAEGKSGEKETYGVASPWCDYSGTRDGVTEGLAILQHPSNRWYPSPWFTRDYGFFSPTPMEWIEGGKLELKKGETFRLRYRVVVHAGDAQAADIAGEFEKFVKGD
ncbi:MAG: PmoA family protein [FCB group bacterium]|nr:PmoA family protein [FCB group bacterium]